MDELQKHYIKWNKADKKGYIRVHAVAFQIFDILYKIILQTQKSHHWGPEIRGPEIREWDGLQRATGEELSVVEDVLYFDCDSGSW